MGTTSKPRKQYRQRSTKQGLDIAVATRWKHWYQSFEFAVYEHLPKGNATREQVLCVMDMFRTVYVSSVVRGNMPNRDEVQNLLHDAEDACYEVLRRKTMVCTGDELKAITEATAMCAPYILESIEVCPRTFLREWATNRRVLQDKFLVSNADDSTIKRIYKKA